MAQLAILAGVRAPLLVGFGAKYREPQTDQTQRAQPGGYSCGRRTRRGDRTGASRARCQRARLDGLSGQSFAARAGAFGDIGRRRSRAGERASRILCRPRGQGDLFRARRLRMRAATATARLQGDGPHAQNLRRLLGRNLHPQRAGRFRRDGIVSRADGRDGFCARPESARVRAHAGPARRQTRWLRA